MFNLIRNVSTLANDETISGLLNFASGAVSTWSSSREDLKLKVLQQRELNALIKCENGSSFAVYKSKTEKPIFSLIYMKQHVLVKQSVDQKECQELKVVLSQFDMLFDSINQSSDSFLSQIESLISSIMKNHDYKAIHHACALGLKDAIISLCSFQEPIIIANEASFDGILPLQLATKCGHEDVVMTLLELGASLSKLDLQQRNAIHYAAEEHTGIVKKLTYCNGFKEALKQCDSEGMTPLCCAIMSGNFDHVRVLLSVTDPATVLPEQLCKALCKITSTNQSDIIIKALLEFSPGFLGQSFQSGESILHQNMELQIYRIVLEKLSNEMNFNVRDSHERTPLHFAVIRENLSQVLLFLAYECDVNAQDRDGNTPLHIAVKLGSCVLVKILLCFYAQPDVCNNSGEKPLDIAKHLRTSAKTAIIECVRLFTEPEASSIVKVSSGDDELNDFMQNLALESKGRMIEKGKKLINAVCLDGGGIRGLVLIQILTHIEKKLGKSIVEYFDWLAGTSTGAILAVTLARGDSLRHCQRMYLKLKDEIFIGKRPYSETVFEDVLKTHFGDSVRMANLDHKKVMITATSVSQNIPRLVMFRNYRLNLSDRENSSLGYRNPKTDFIWKCIRYSCAAPTFFPPKDSYLDGGLIANNPTLDLLTDVHHYNAAQLKTKNDTISLGCLVSIGTGQQPVTSVNVGKFDFDIPQGIAKCVEMISDFNHLKNIFIEQITSSNGECVKRANSWAHDQRIPFYRFSPPLSSYVRLDETNNEAIAEFLWDTEKYLRTDGQASVRSLVNFLDAYQTSE